MHAMTTAAATPDDPIALLGRLSTGVIQARLDALEAEQRALRTLLRAARARERALARGRAAAKGEGQEERE
jgi:hypothetical protein